MESDWARPVVHWEIEAVDPERIAGFYRELFNWEIGAGKVKAIAPGLGAPEPQISGHIIGGRESRVVLNIQVRDLRASMEKAVALGGSVLREPFDIPGGPTLAWITDPEGNRVTLVQQ
ncbi:MAG: glyoxalase [Dehalococcoidia bacterium]|nr:glyoxalase [Dehalococcoidia bacterium]